MRFYEAMKGGIYFTSKSKSLNISEVSNESLREVIGYVGQEPVLIGKTIREVLMAEQCTDHMVY